MRHRMWAISRGIGPRGRRTRGQARFLRAGPVTEPHSPARHLSPAVRNSRGGAVIPVRRPVVGVVPFTWIAFLSSAVLILLLGTPIAAQGAPPASNRPLTVAALGDSYSSGEGSPPFDLGGCRRSTTAWPRLLAGLTPAANPVLLAACGGATTADLTSSQRDNPAQLNQLRALSPAPDVVTITIGGNDAGFSRVLLSCVVWKCFWNGDERRRRDYIQDDLPELLVKAYKDVKAAAPNSRVVVVGYPDLFPRSQRDNTCRWLDSSERRKLVSLNNTLNRTIRNAARDADVEFVSTSRSVRDHEMCTAEPWVNPVGLFSPSRALSAHPTQAGQEAIARTVHKALFDGR